MGVIRFLLAMTVVLGHCAGFYFVGGTNAVQIFYMISGFLMSYILVEQRAYKTVFDFYLSRYLRLYPIYIVVAAITLGVFALASATGQNIRYFSGINFWDLYKNNTISANIYLVFSNLTLLFQDWVLFLETCGGHLAFTPDFAKCTTPLWRGLLVPQAWSLGVEISFYLVAPFVLPKKKIFFCFLVGAILIRAFLILIGIGLKDPWTYRFFPAEILFFLLGSFSHQYVTLWYKKFFVLEKMPMIAKTCMGTVLVISTLYPYIPAHEWVKSTFLFGVIFFVLPLAFLFSNRNTWDRRLGDLSYPIYICFIVVIYVVDLLLGAFSIHWKTLRVVLVLGLTLYGSILLHKYIIIPVDRWRARIRVPAARDDLRDSEERLSVR
ncbi:MAG: acyltransferase [Bdellovibrionales bacterium]